MRKFLFAFPILSLCFLIFGCKKSDVKPTIRYDCLLEISPYGAFGNHAPDTLHISYTDSNLIQRNWTYKIDTIGNIPNKRTVTSVSFAFGSLYKSGSITITAYIANGFPVDILFQVSQNHQTTATHEIHGNGKQTISFSIP